MEGALCGGGGGGGGGGGVFFVMFDHPFLVSLHFLPFCMVSLHHVTFLMFVSKFKRRGYIPASFLLMTSRSLSLLVSHCATHEWFHSFESISISAVFPTPVSPSMIAGTPHS